MPCVQGWTFIPRLDALPGVTCDQLQPVIILLPLLFCDYWPDSTSYRMLPVTSCDQKSQLTSFIATTNVTIYFPWLVVISYCVTRSDQKPGQTYYQVWPVTSCDQWPHTCIKAKSCLFPSTKYHSFNQHEYKELGKKGLNSFQRRRGSQIQLSFGQCCTLLHTWHSFQPIRSRCRPLENGI